MYISPFYSCQNEFEKSPGGSRGLHKENELGVAILQTCKNI